MKKLSLASIVAVPALMVGAHAIAQTTSPDSAPASAVAPDNTKSNRVDPSNRGATSDKQGNDATDIDLVKRIRQSVMADKTLSTYGHNVKIVAVNGIVTLNGVVDSAAEKAQIGQKAAAIAGRGHVIDDMKLAPSK
jgi:osmotically-inducible protein OsmY